MWTTLALKLIGSVLLIFASSLIVDWIFSGSKWVHKFYAAAPEIWRPLEGAGVGRSERRAISLSLLMTAVFSLVYVLFYFIIRPGLIFTSAVSRALATGFFLWLLIPLPHLVTQHLFVKYHRAITALQLAGWLIKLITAALIMTLLF